MSFCFTWFTTAASIVFMKIYVPHVSSLFPRARCRQWLEMLRPLASAESQVMHLGLPMIALCGDCFVRVIGNGLRRGVQTSKVRCCQNKSTHGKAKGHNSQISKVSCGKSMIQWRKANRHNFKTSKVSCCQ